MREENTLQSDENNSLTLNLIVWQKRQLDPGKISLLKRRAQHRRKQIQREKHAEIKTQRAPTFTVGALIYINSQIVVNIALFCCNSSTKYFVT